MPGMTFDQLKTFLAVAEHLHFTRAAEALYITQPSVSTAIQNLETQYGVRLFDRVGRRIEITQAGKLLQKEARKILDHVAATERGLRELNNLQQGELRVGASINVGNYWLPEKICQFKRQYPGIVVRCTLGNAEEISEGTVSGDFDLGLVTKEMSPALEQYLMQEVVGVDRLQIVVGRSHPWFRRQEVLLDELLTTAWVMRESGSGAQQIFEQALQDWGVDLNQINVILVLSSSEMVKTVVEGGVGAAAIPGWMVTKEIQFETLHSVCVIDSRTEPFTKLEMLQPIWKLKHQQRYQTQMSIAFEQLLPHKAATKLE